MTFAPVSTCDRALIYSFTARYAGNSADLTMHSLFCWGETYPSFWCLEDGFLIIRIHFPEPGGIYYSIPMGSGDLTPQQPDESSTFIPLPCRGDICHLIKKLKQDAQSLGAELRFLGGNDQTREAVRKTLPHYGRYYLRSNSDYIYSRSDLQSLKGRKYQPKRNHLNHFLANYDYIVEPLAKERTSECLQMLEEWENEHIARITALSSQPDKVNDSASEYLKELEREKVCIKRAFGNWDQLGLRGIVLYAKEKRSEEREGTGNKLAAFCYGSAINENTFCTHIEKALESVTGSYAAINQLFAKSLPPQFTFINREDDLGHTGLRTAKESYHPSGVEHKFIMAPMSTQMQQIRSLWLECFPEEQSEDAEQFLFTRFKPEKMLCHNENGRVVSMLHIIEFINTVHGNTVSNTTGSSAKSNTEGTTKSSMEAATKSSAENSYKYAYIYAVATSKEYRKKGIAGALIEQAIDKCRKEGFNFVCLIPSDNHLREWYKKYGFTVSRPVSFHTSDEYDFGTGDDSRNEAAILPLSGESPEEETTLYLSDPLP